MSNSIQPVSRLKHLSKRWGRYSNYSFASSTALAPLAAAEVHKAAISLPLAFIERGNVWTMGAMLGLSPDQNLYVSPAGSWIGTYTPAFFRAYPFRTSWNEALQPVLCIDENSGLVFDGDEGETFFDEEGHLSDSVTQVWAFLQETARSELALEAAATALHAAGLIEPWSISIQEDQNVRQLSGLYRVDEKALNNLDYASFGSLRQVGAIGLAYAQLLSMGNLAVLSHLAHARSQVEAAERARAEVKPMMALPDDSTIDWDWSKVGRT